MHWPEAPFVMGHIRTNRRLDGKTGISMSVVEHDIDAARALRRRTGEVDENFIPRHSHFTANHNRLFETIAPGFVAPFTAGQLGDLCADGSFGTADNLIGHWVNAIKLELFHHFKQRATAGI